MGHFEDAGKLEGVEIVFRFDQSSNDELLAIFGNADAEFILQSGVCAGTCFDLIHTAANTTPKIPLDYTLDTMQAHAAHITALQHYVREKNLKLSELLTRLSLTSQIKPVDARQVHDAFFANIGAHVLSHNLPQDKGGNHVAIIIVRPLHNTQKEALFYDALKGLLRFQLTDEASERQFASWVKKYLAIYHDKIHATTQLQSFHLPEKNLVFNNCYQVIAELSMPNAAYTAPVSPTLFGSKKQEPAVPENKQKIQPTNS